MPEMQRAQGGKAHLDAQMAQQSLYILRAGGYWKIGRAVDVDRRIRQLQCGCPEAIELYADLDVAADNVASTDIEHRLHQRLSPYRTSGEWFHAPERIIQHAVKEIWAMLAHPALYTRWQRQLAWRRAEGKA